MLLSSFSFLLSFLGRFSMASTTPLAPPHYPRFFPLLAQLEPPPTPSSAATPLQPYPAALINIFPFPRKEIPDTATERLLVVTVISGIVPTEVSTPLRCDRQITRTVLDNSFPYHLVTAIICQILNQAFFSPPQTDRTPRQTDHKEDR